jgi:hypothetical protein
LGRLSVKKIAKLTEPGRYSDGHGLRWRALRTDRGFSDTSATAKNECSVSAPCTRLRWRKRESEPASLGNRSRMAKIPLNGAGRKKPSVPWKRRGTRPSKSASRPVSTIIARHGKAAYRQDWLSTLQRYAYPEFGELPVAQIDAGLVLRVLKPLWLTKTKTAKMLRQRIKAVLNWATAHAYRDGENPARLRGNLEHMLPKAEKVRRVVHHAALPHVEIGVFMGEFRVHDSIPARALEFLILTVARAGICESRRAISATERPGGGVDCDRRRDMKGPAFRALRQSPRGLAPLIKRYLPGEASTRKPSDGPDGPDAQRPGSDPAWVIRLPNWSIHRAG